MGYLSRLAATMALLAALAPDPAGAQTRFRFPAEDPDGTLFLLKPLIHADHDPQVSELAVECINYAGVEFPWCYDEHRGTDFLLRGAFVTMDEHDVPVVAGADGVVVRAVDGNYDRCHGTQGLEVSCDGHPMRANQVVLEHADGLRSLYVHLKKGSVQVAEGDSVVCGQLLGYVGSSGMSATPHLHFELHDASGQWIDPFAGSHSQPTSYWVEQEGPHGRPAPRCVGEPVAPDSSSGPPLDGGVAPGPDAAGGAGGTDPATGCAVGRPGAPAPLWPLLLLGLGLAARRRGRRASKRLAS